MSDQFLFDVNEDVVLHDLGSLSPEPDYRSFVSNDDIQQMKDIIQKQNSELDSLRKQVQDHHHFFILMKARSVQCLSAFSKYKDSYMSRDPKAVTRLDDLLLQVNRLLPTHMKPMDRTELLDSTRQLNEAQNLGIVWRKSNNDYACDGWTLRKHTLPQKPTLPQLNTTPIVSIQPPTMSTISPINSPGRGSMSPTSPAPVIMNRK